MFNSLQDINLLISLSTAVIVFISIFIYYHFKTTFSYWEKKGLKGPEPKPVIGNLWQLFREDRKKIEIEWAQKYGEVYGIYQGSKPTLVIADPEILTQICVKDFDVAPNHNNTPHFMPKIFRLFIFNSVDEHWKRIRTLMSPTFTSAKMKRMFKLLNNCADDAVDCFNEQLLNDKKQRKPKGVVNAKDLFNLYTMDGITRTCYGIKLERDGSNDLKSAASRDEFVSEALKIFDLNLIRPLIMFTLPKFLLQVFGFELVPSNKFQGIVQRAQGVIKNRRTTGKKYDDYLQLLIDAKLEDKLDLNELDLEENHHASLTVESLQDDQKKFALEIKTKSNCLTEDEIIAHATLLLAVGLETTSALLTNCFYILAFHSQIQEKLYSEIMKISIKRENSALVDFEYDSLTSCRYLDSVISETLRMMPPFVAIPRELKQDYHIKKYNLDLPKDLPIFLAVHAIHNNAKYWDNPSDFNPDRFMPGNKEKIKPGTYAPFGIGPRHCLGMRFSLTEAKIGLAKILSVFRIEPAPNTCFPPESKLKIGVSSIKNPKVQLVVRN